MVDDNKVLKGLKIIKIVGIIVIVIVIIVVAYINYMEKTNSDKFYKCLKNNNISKDTANKGNDNTNINYSTFNNKKYLMSKEISFDDKIGTTNIVLYYNKDKNRIDGELSLVGNNNNDNYGIYLIYGKYNMKIGKYKCKISQDDGFDSRCNMLLKESKTFSNQITELLKSCNVNMKYVQKSKITSKYNK